jgi:hypothetical protein
LADNSVEELNQENLFKMLQQDKIEKYELALKNIKLTEEELERDMACFDRLESIKDRKESSVRIWKENIFIYPVLENEKEVKYSEFVFEKFIENGYLNNISKLNIGEHKLPV